MNAAVFALSAVTFSLAYTPFDNYLKRRKTALWMRYIAALAVGVPVIWGLNRLLTGL